MGDTFNTFVKFISDDPIMLGLCIAIIVLVVLLFIIVLFVGRRKDTRNESAIENTTELLKTEINLESLKSTQEYSLNELQNSNLSSNEENISLNEENIITAEPRELESSAPVVEEVDSEVVENDAPVEADLAMEVPVTTEEPIPLEMPVIEPQAEVFEASVEPVIEMAPIAAEETVQDEPVTDQNGGLDEQMLMINEQEPIVEEPVQVEDTQIEPEDPAFEDFNIVPESKSESESNSDSEENMVLETQMETNPTLEVPIIEDTVVVPDPLDEATIAPIVESSVSPVEDISGDNIMMSDMNVTDLDPVSLDPIIESTPIEEELETQETQEETVTVEETIPEIVDQPVMEPVKEEQSESVTDLTENVESPQDQPTRSVYLDTIEELPEIKIENFNRTAILERIPVMESMPSSFEEKEEQNIELPKGNESDSEDVDLPKLNINDDASALNFLKGESFDIN